MKIQKLFGVEQSSTANDFVVVIDVFRAATTAAAALYTGARKIVPVASKEDALLYRNTHKETFIMGEERGEQTVGFDFGNSPYRISRASIDGMTIVHRSTQGTQGLVRATQATTLVFGAFVTASAIIRYVRQKQPSIVSFIALAGPGTEDEYFADYMIARLHGEEPSMKPIIERLRKQFGTEWFFDPNKPEVPEEDFLFCLELDKYDFVVEAVRTPHLHLIKRKV